MNNFAAFGIRFNDALSLLPTSQKMAFMASLIGSLSVHVSDETAFRLMERALDDAQGFNQPKMQLVKR